MRIKRRKGFLDGWGVVSPDGDCLILDDSGAPKLFRVPEEAVAAGNAYLSGQAWAVRWIK